tara:strand:+ start:372 stop:1421 length:1050 start_codon:yes stop_codon:yes gene_type:complete
MKKFIVFICFFMFFSFVQSRTILAIDFIDVHVHLVGGRGDNVDYEGAVDTALEVMNRIGIEKAIIMSPPQIPSVDGYDYSAFIDALNENKDRFLFLGGGGSLNVLLHKYRDKSLITEEIKSEFRKLAVKTLKDGAIGFGEMASLHISAVSGHPYEFVPADHPLLKILADVAAKFDVPIDLHMDAASKEMPTPFRFKDADNPDNLPATIPALKKLLAHNLKAKIVWAHGGSDPLGSMSASLISSLMDKYPNLYVSLRVVGGRAPMFNKIMSFGEIEPVWSKLFNRHPDRFVIGSDSFFISPDIKGAGPGAQFGRRNIQKLKATKYFLSLLPSEIALKISKENAMRIYKIE